MATQHTPAPPGGAEAYIRHHLEQHLGALPPAADGQTEVTMCYLDVQNATSEPQCYGAGTFAGPLDRSTPEALQRVFGAFLIAVPYLAEVVRAADAAHPVSHVLVIYTLTLDGCQHRGAIGVPRG